MKRVAWASIILMVFLNPSISMSLDRNTFNDLISKIRAKEFAPVEEFLNSNKDVLIKDPEYYVLLLNYVANKGKKEEIVVDAPPGEGKYDAKVTTNGEAKQKEIELRNPNTGKAVGFIGSKVFYDEDLIASGIKQTQQALQNFNDRLDIHFGIISVAENINRPDIVGNQLVSVIKVSIDIGNKWIWGPINSMDGDPKDFMIQNVLSRISKMFYAETAVADESCIKVSKALIEHYPDMIYGYANLGTIYMAKNQLNLAKTYYDKALEIDPGDDIVIANMKRLKELLKEQ